MKYIYLITLILALNACKSNQNNNSGQLTIQSYYKNYADSTILQLNELSILLESKNSNVTLRNKFLACRYFYKHIEPMVEYYFQGLNKRINGPALPDVKIDDNQVFPPKGFQVIEQYLWTDNPFDNSKNIKEEINVLISDLKFSETQLLDQSILPRHLREMIQHQIIRIATNSITGLDAPISFNSLHESHASLEGIIKIINKYISAESKINKNDFIYETQLKRAIAYLSENRDFNTFNRMNFILNYLMPLSESLKDFPVTQTTEDEEIKKAFNGTLKDLMTGKGYNPDYFSPYAIAASNKSKIEMGEKLFYDVKLSRSSTISCAKCHQKEKYFTDGNTKAENFAHGGILNRNTPTLYYAAFQASQFYDSRTTTLEEQINDVMQNDSEFNLADNELIAKISQVKEYKKLSKNAFDNDSLDNFKIRNAIAAYVRTLMPFSSNFDKYMQGDQNALNNGEINGFNLFMGKAKCGTCHFAPIFNGTLPPWYTKSESEIIGIPKFSAWKNAIIDDDRGRYEINKLEELKYAFKTPTIRNIDKTGPYMHNGVYKSLEEVLKFYHVGGGVGIGIDLPFQSLPFDSLNLSDSEVKDIVAFMKTLTDKQ